MEDGCSHAFCRCKGDSDRCLADVDPAVDQRYGGEYPGDSGSLRTGSGERDLSSFHQPGYAQLQLNDPRFAPCHESLKKINASTESYLMVGIHMDEIGMAWIIDNENGFIWHNGGTGHYNSYLGFCPETNTAVVVLSNLSPNDRIPATVLGIKRLQELNK